MAIRYTLEIGELLYDDVIYYFIALADDRGFVDLYGEPTLGPQVLAHLTFFDEAGELVSFFLPEAASSAKERRPATVLATVYSPEGERVQREFKVSPDGLHWVDMFPNHAELVADVETDHYYNVKGEKVREQTLLSVCYRKHGMNPLGVYTPPPKKKKPVAGSAEEPPLFKEDDK